MSSERPLVVLSDQCQHPAGCPAQRLRYSGLCTEHDPSWAPTPPLACRAPHRCYCPQCRQTGVEQGPTMGPEAVRLILSRRRA